MNSIFVFFNEFKSSGVRNINKLKSQTQAKQLDDEQKKVTIEKEFHKVMEIVCKETGSRK